jgi:hypothetical protein
VNATAAAAVVADVDVLIVGGTTAAAAAALAAAQSGCRVLLATPRTYLGEDVTAFARFADPAGEPAGLLARRLFALGVPTPMHVKETLERELLHAGVELLYGCQPGGALIAGDGRVAGAAILSRAGRAAVLARAVIDATWTATFARQAGCTFRCTGRRNVQFAWTLAAPQAPPGAVPAGSVAWRADRNTARELPLWRHWFEAALDVEDPASLAALEVDARLRLFDPRQFFTADNVFFLPPGRLERSVRGLWVLPPAGDLPDDEAAKFLQPCKFMEIGQAAGQAVAAGLPPRSAGELTLRCRGAQPLAGLHLDGRDLRGARASGLPAIELPAAMPVLGEVDVLVVGGGTAGAPAGIAAARQGRRTLVVEALAGLGGLGTWGQISRYYFGHRAGFTADVDAGVAAMGPPDPAARPGGWRVEWKRTWWLRALREAGAELWPDTIACGVQVQDGRVSGVVVAGPAGCGLVRARCVVDASGAADIAAAAGAETIQPGLERAAVQGTGLSPREPGRDYANSDHTFADDGDVRDATRSFVAARRKFRERFDLAPILSTRERRRVVADVMVQPEDIFAGRTWPDAVNIASSNFDTHGFTIHPMFTAVPPGKQEYRAVVPLRALLPRGLEGVLVTGLGIGAHRDAMPVLRMQPCVQNQGYAAGLVAAAAVATGGRIRDVDFAPIQRRLIAMGVLDEAACAPDPFPLGGAALDAAVAAEPHAHRDLAVLFAHADRARPRLRSALAGAGEPARRERLAVLLGLMGDAAASATLTAAIAARGWDRGWNYRGMDQFGASRSELDTLLWAAAGAPTAELFPAVLGKLQALAEWHSIAADVNLSHAQAISAACAALARFDAQRQFPPLLARLLTFHLVTGNHQTDWDAVFSDQPRAVNHNEARSRALRELALAVGLFACGDHDGAAGVVLERFARDWRGPLAHHARAALESR